MSGTFPAAPGPETATLDSDQPTTVTYSESAKSQARSVGGHLWFIKMSWSTLKRDMAAPIFGFINSQRGRFSTFQIVLPNYSQPLGNVSGSPLTSVAATKKSDSVVVKSLPTNVTDVIKIGDIIKFSNHSKVYMINADASSNASGNSTWSFDPPLIEDVAANMSIQWQNVPFTVRMTDDKSSWKGSAPNLVKLSYDMTEAIT